MIKKVACIIGRELNPYRNMAVEEHLMNMALPDTAVLFLWHSAPCVELGCGLDLAASCDVSGILQQRFFLTRRKSGGEAFYLDSGTLGYSIIVPRRHWDLQNQREVLQLALSRLQIHTLCEVPYTISLPGHLPIARQTYYLNGDMGLERGILCLQTDPLTAAYALNHSASQTMHGLQEKYPSVNDAALSESLCSAMGSVYCARPYWLNEFLMDRGTLDRRERYFSGADWIERIPVTDTQSLTQDFSWGRLTVGLQYAGGIITDCTLRSSAMEAALLLELEHTLIGAPCLIGAIRGRIEQKVNQFSNPGLKRLLRDACSLICDRINQNEPEERG